jgi:AcrR family transcriptional regulator
MISPLELLQQTIGLLNQNLADRWSLRKGPPVCKILGVAVFQRARNQEQREARRQAILGAAAAMLAEMPVAQVTLNELSRRAGLAKSNVLRYFESREAVLLELLDSAWRDWLAQLEPDLEGAVDAAAPVAERADQVADGLASSLASRPMLCDLISAQAAVLERNVSPQVAAQYKRASIADITALGQLAFGWLPELGEEAVRLAGATVMMTAALWPHTQPSAAMLAAYEADPALAAMRLDFTETLREVLQVMIAGLLARSSC